jgi:hypothetical protein
MASRRHRPAVGPSISKLGQHLRQQPGGTIGIAGSPSLVRSLLDQGLLGELTLM